MTIVAIKKTGVIFIILALITSGASPVLAVTGKSKATMPYAPVDVSHVVSGVINKEGGVLSTDLPKGIKAYLIIPKDVLIENTSVTLAPYTAMPSGKTHGNLSSTLGYGVQVGIDSLQSNTPAYLVFDVRNGKATSEASKKALYFNRCDPRFSWFNPFLCARMNKVAPSKMVEKNYTVITPIHKKEFNNIIYTRNTIPTGINGLLVTKISHGDVYIPQKLTKSLATHLVKKALQGGSQKRYGQDTDRLEAAALALSWGIKLNENQLTVVNDTVLNAGDTPQEHLKTYFVAQSYKKKNSDGDFKEDMDNAISNAAEILIQEVPTDKRDFEGDESVERAAGISAGALGGIPGASDAASGALDGPISDGVGSSLDAAEAGIFADDVAGGSDFADEAASQVHDYVSDLFSDATASIADILRGLGLDQQYGNDTEQSTQAALDIIRKILELLLKNNISSMQAYEAGAIAQQLGFEDLGSAFVEYAQGKSEAEACGDIIKKTLANYGVNECK